MATVLVVDDDPVNREFLRTLLVQRGHRVCEADDGQSALDLAEREPPDAVITDVLLPGIDGYELARLLRGRPETSRVPIAFSTAHYERHEIERLARVCGVHDVIMKPAHPRVVLATVDSMLSAGPVDPQPVATLEEFTDEHRKALKTKLFETAAALRLSEGRLRAITRTTGAGVLLADEDGMATYANARLAEITGRPRETLLRKGWLDCLDPSDGDRLRAAIIQGVPEAGCEHRVLAPRGPQRRWLEIRMHPLGEGFHERLVVFVEDVTEAVRAQQRLATAHSREAGLRRRAGRLDEQLNETQRVTRCGTWGLDPRTGVIELSHGLRELLRLPSSAIGQQVLFQRVHPDDLEKIVSMAERTLRTGRPQVVGLRVADLDGVVHELVVSCRVSATQHETGLTTQSLWGVAHDVSEAHEERIRLQMRADWRAQRRVLDRMRLAMFPRDLPEVPGVDLAAAHVAAPDRLDAAGDWYDVLPLDGGGVVLSVGDVAGQDRNAAAVMGPMRAVLRAFALEDPDPARIMARLNRFVLSSYVDDTYVTAVVAHYEPGSHRLLVANAGQPAPLLLDGERVVPVAEPGPALGIIRDAEFAVQDLRLDPGMVLCACTDGLTDPHADPQRLNRVAFETYQQLPHGQATAQRLLDEILRQMLAGCVRDDDLCLAVLRAI